MNEKMPGTNEPSTAPQELADALVFAQRTGHSSYDRFIADDSTKDGGKATHMVDVRANAFLDKEDRANVQLGTHTEQNFIRNDDGKAIGGAHYQMSGGNSIKYDEHGNAHFIGPEAPVAVTRRVKDTTTGEIVNGTVKELTGERARKANEILARRAARAIGGAALKRIQDMDYTPPQ